MQRLSLSCNSNHVQSLFFFFKCKAVLWHSRCMLDQKYDEHEVRMSWSRHIWVIQKPNTQNYTHVAKKDKETNEETMTGLSFPSSNYIHPIVVEIRCRPIIGPGWLLGRSGAIFFLLFSSQIAVKINSLKNVLLWFWCQNPKTGNTSQLKA